MYETAIMIKPGEAFSTDELHEIVLDVAKSGDGVVERKGSHIRVSSGDGWLEIARDSSGGVVVESDEIAERFSIPCRGCKTRFDMIGDDPDMVLFNDYLMINERAQATGKVVIFDSQECKLMFEDEA